MKLAQITDDLAIQPHKVTAVKRISARKTAIFCSGQSAQDGNFLVFKPYGEVMDILQEALVDEEARYVR
jgi:hypothetical protein